MAFFSLAEWLESLIEVIAWPMLSYVGNDVTKIGVGVGVLSRVGKHS